MEQKYENDKQKELSTKAYINEDEINLLELVYILVKRKKIIIVFTLLGLILGFLAALIKGPTFISEVIIAPKENESQKTPSVAGFGALSGLVAGQLTGMFGTLSIEKIDLVLDSREFNAKLIEEYNLLNRIYKYEWPKVYKKYWDEKEGKWKDNFKKPKLMDIGNFIKSKYLKKTVNKNNTLTFKIQMRDSTFSEELANIYLKYLNEYIKTNVQNEAKENVAYLEKQLVGVSDPLLREKILGLIANEIEKQMLVSKDAFKIIDPVYRYTSYKEKKLYPVIFCVSLFLISCIFVIFSYYFFESEKTQEDKELLDKIKHELCILPKRK
jgi:flagellar basal body-associated protein FliL